MAFCPNCGTQAAGAFCPNCGSALGAAGGSYGAPSSVGQTSGLTDNLASALCYAPFLIGLVCNIIFLVLAPYNRNRTIRFNAFQSLFLHLALFVFWIVVQMIVGSVALITHGLGFLLVTVYPLLWLAILGLFIYLIIKSYNNQKVKLPFIGDLAEKQA
jgi:uncharacterized membrane protein